MNLITHWCPSNILANDTKPKKFCLIILNQPISQKKLFDRLWSNGESERKKKIDKTAGQQAYTYLRCAHISRPLLPIQLPSSFAQMVAPIDSTTPLRTNQTNWNGKYHVDVYVRFHFRKTCISVYTCQMQIPSE